MTKLLTSKEFSERWDISDRRVRDLCKEGKIPGAIKEGNIWKIPADATKPVDKRVKSGVYKKSTSKKKLPLPIGISDYRVASTNYYYIDKTLLIKDFLDERPMVSLFMRPRRFGKTLNMDMLRTYFEKTDEDTSIYFKDKKIWACGNEYRKYQGQYPVIFVTFKDIKKTTWEETYSSIAQTIILEYKRHSELMSSDKVKDLDYYEKVINNQISDHLFDLSLYMLSKMLHEHHGIAPIIIIDEYDIPIQQGYSYEFYDEVILFMRNLFSGAFKDNQHLSYGFMTGILRVAKESIFSGLNNLKLNSILDNRYGEYFGFTTDEIVEIARYYGMELKLDEVREWYNGYRFGKTDIYNPWSVINYFNNECEPRPFWQATGSNEIIGDILEEATEDIYERLNLLVQGKTIMSYIDTSVIYPQIKNNPSSIYSFLLVTGYLKVLKTELAFNGDFLCELALPNKEISYVYNKEILQKLQNVIPQTASISIQEALYLGNVDNLKKQLGDLLIQSASCYDTVGEIFYHGLVLGLCAMMDNYYYVTSNRESGLGRYDIQLMPKVESMPGIIIELKAQKTTTGLKTLAQNALEQINTKQYDTELKTRGIKKIIKYGVAFSGKQVEIVIE